MTAVVQSTPNFASQLVNGILAIQPLAHLAKQQARSMMIKRAESIGVYWHEEVKALRSREQAIDFAPEWEVDLVQIQDSQLVYPEYYLRSFHAYAEGNLGWQPAMEVEVAAYAVHARIWPEAGSQGDSRLRQSYHNVLKAKIPQEPRDILDLGCSVGMSTFALQSTYPQAQLTGVDLSPYFLTIAQYRTTHPRSSSTGESQLANRPRPIWIHALAESTGLPNCSFDLVSAHLIFHELPEQAAIAILHEARRLLRPNGTLGIMDMNPKSEIYAKMPPYILTLLKSTEPYLDEYFGYDLEQAIYKAGFARPEVTRNSARHRTLVAQVR
jgi:ubiquinone/menaquinone biosynthesis C-methylase UbiE